jgi:PAS domain S-box-containing protein
VASLFGSARGADVPVPGAPFPFAAELREAADGPGPIFAGRALWDRTGAATAEPAVLVVVPLLSAPGVRAGAAFAAFCMGPVVQHLVSARSQESQLITLFDATRSVIASLDPRLRPSRALGSHYPVSALGADPGTFAYYPPPDDSLASRVALDLRRSAYEPVDPPGWGVVVDVPAETLHASVAPHAARILLFLGLTLALLYAAVAVLARQVAVPLQRVDETAARIAAGRYESDPGLAELVRSPIAELRHLAAHFLRMEQALAAHDEEAVTALRESEERYRRVVELSPDAIVVETEAGISFLNAAALRLLGLQGGEQAIGRSIASFMHAEDVDFGRLAIAKCLALAPPFSSQRRFVHTEGSVRSAEIAVTAFQHGGRPAVLIVARDVTERQRAEEERERYQAAIQQAAQEWRETFDAIDSPVVLVDRRGNAARLNRAACQLSGHGFEDALGRPLAFLGAGSPWREACELAERVRAGGATEVANVSDPASERSWELTASRVPTAGEGGVRVILVARDTTALVRLQDSLRRRETMSAMGALVAGVAHEVRNPLFAISATLDAAELRLAGLPEARPHVQILRREVQRLSDLMEDLLDYGRPQGQELRPGPIRPVVHEAVALLNAQLVEIGVGVDVVCPEDLPQVAMDRRRLLQVFKNLVENAVYHAPRGSRVSVSLAAQDGPRPHIECAVRDSGKGFTPEDLDRVFEPFYTRRRGGTGLGLSIVQRIVEEHGGSVSVRNRPEGGAEVVTRLPVAAAAAHAPSAR